MSTHLPSAISGVQLLGVQPLAEPTYNVQYTVAIPTVFHGPDFLYLLYLLRAVIFIIEVLFLL